MPKNKSQRQPVLVRFEPRLLAKLEKIAETKCISRNAFIQFVLSSALDKIRM
jgi:hypothetical protein